MPWVTEISSNHVIKAILTNVSKETSPILVILFLGNELQNFRRETFTSPFVNQRRQEGEKTQRKYVIAKLFALNANATKIN